MWTRRFPADATQISGGCECIFFSFFLRYWCLIYCTVSSDMFVQKISTVVYLISVTREADSFDKWQPYPPYLARVQKRAAEIGGCLGMWGGNIVCVIFRKYNLHKSSRDVRFGPRLNWGTSETEMWSYRLYSRSKKSWSPPESLHWFGFFYSFRVVPVCESWGTFYSCPIWIWGIQGFCSSIYDLFYRWWKTYLITAGRIPGFYCQVICKDLNLLRKAEMHILHFFQFLWIFSFC